MTHIKHWSKSGTSNNNRNSRHRFAIF